MKLSFEDGEEGKSNGRPMLIRADDRPTKKFTKNPHVDTSFLPDRAREESERLEREELRKQWLVRQEEIKLEPIEITYSFWDGSGHRKTVEVRLLRTERIAERQVHERR
jgi:protein FAM50